MYNITVSIPDEFLQPLDEIAEQTQAYTREEVAKRAIREAIVTYQMLKDFQYHQQQLQQQQQERLQELIGMWP